MSMLTIKHVEANGYQSVQQAHNVSFIPKTLAHPDKIDPYDEVIAYGCTGIGGPVDEHGVCRYANGRVYVMNDAGATVSNFDLD